MSNETLKMWTRLLAVAAVDAVRKHGNCAEDYLLAKFKGPCGVTAINIACETARAAIAEAKGA